jgi:anthranilate phosphoribosyltransferase
VLAALGAKIELTPEQAKTCLERSGFTFMLAPSFHPAMRFAGPTRREIGVRTIFNSLGPLTNPAGARHLLLGVGDEVLAPKIAQVAARLGTGRALVVHGEDGLDEVTLHAPTRVFDITGHDIREDRITPEDAGFERLPLDAVKSGTPEENAAKMRQVFAGEQGPHRDFVLVNAGAALLAAGRAKDLREGVRLATESIDSGAAGRALIAFVAASNEV